MTPSNSADDFEPEDDFVADDFEEEAQPNTLTSTAYKDPVSEMLRAKAKEPGWEGFEPDFSEELDRAQSYGTAEALRGLLSGASLGYSQMIPLLQTGGAGGMAPGPQGKNLASGIGEVTGELLPLTGLSKIFSGPLVKLASKSPVLQRSLTSLAHITGAAATGATAQTLKTISKGDMPSVEDAIEHGAEWGALDAALQAAGATGRFASSLLKRSKITGKTPAKELNTLFNQMREQGIEITQDARTGAKALEILEQEAPELKEVITPEYLKAKKIVPAKTEVLSKEVEALAEPYQPNTANYTAEADALGETALENKLTEAAPRAGTLDELGTNIKSDVEASLEAAKEEYKPLYEAVDNVAEDILHVPKNVGSVGGDNLLKIGRVKTRPEGFGTVTRTLETALEDAGYNIVRNEQGAIEQIISTKPVPVSKTIELARRLNEIADYEAIEPSVIDVVKRLARAAKADVRAGLAQNPDALAAFELAEEAYGRTASKFGRDSIRRIRKTQAGETVAGMTKSPTTLTDLKAVTSPTQYAQIEREILENIKTQNYNQASKTFREVGKQLSESNRQLAKEIVEAKNPFNPSVKTKKIQEGILQDVSEAFNTGTRPEKALRLWRTPKGQKLIQDTFKGSPNWKDVKGYLEKQTFNDMVSSILNDAGKIDKQKLRNFMKDPAAVNNIRQLGGEEAVEFFRGMESKLNIVESNAKLLTNKPAEEVLKKTFKSERGKEILEGMVNADYKLLAVGKSVKNWLADALNLSPKAAISVFGLMKLGLPNTILSLVGYKIFNRLATSSRARSAFKEMSRKYTSLVPFLEALKNFSDSIDEEA